MATASRSGRGRWMCSDPDDAHLHYRLPHHRTRSRLARAMCAFCLQKRESSPVLAALSVPTLRSLSTRLRKRASRQAVRPSHAARAAGTRGRGTGSVSRPRDGPGRGPGVAGIMVGVLSLFISFFRYDSPYYYNPLLYLTQLSAVLRAREVSLSAMSRSFLPIVR